MSRRRTDIYINGIKFNVAEGESVFVNNFWPEIGKELIFQLYQNITVYAKSQEKTGLGSLIKITKIDFMDEQLVQAKEAAIDVEFTVDTPVAEEKASTPVVEIVKEEVAEEVSDEVAVDLPDFNSMTKKELITFIKENDLDIDVKLTKTQLLAKLMELKAI